MATCSAPVDATAEGTLRGRHTYDPLLFPVSPLCSPSPLALALCPSLCASDSLPALSLSLAPVSRSGLPLSL